MRTYSLPSYLYFCLFLCCIAHTLYALRSVKSIELVAGKSKEKDDIHTNHLMHLTRFHMMYLNYMYTSLPPI